MIEVRLSLPLAKTARAPARMNPPPKSSTLVLGDGLGRERPSGLGVAGSVAEMVQQHHGVLVGT